MKLVVISGVASGLGGVGKVITALFRDAKNFPELQGQVIVKSPSAVSLRTLLQQGNGRGMVKELWSRRTHEMDIWNTLQQHSPEIPFVLIHPQSLTFHWCQHLIKNHSDSVWLYLMDCGFFCLRSYNYIPSESKGCLRCLGGKWKWAKAFECQPFPMRNFHALVFLEKLRNWAAQGTVKIMTQNTLQTDLARRHFGQYATIRQVGVWATDWEQALLPDKATITEQLPKYDIVFHGTSLEAKGFYWALELANSCPQLSFLFPEVKPQDLPPNLYVSKNCFFIPMKWETGLAQAVQQAKVVLVPSLWSAPIEGALIKSLILNRSVAVVKNSTAFSAELPEQLVLYLPQHISDAASMLQNAIAHGWQSPLKLQQEWLDNFKNCNMNLLESLLNVCHG